MGFLFLCGINGNPQILNIVEGVEDPDNINSVCDRTLDKILHHIIRIMAVAQHILAAEQHLEFCIRTILADNPQPFPWIFVQKAKAGIIRGAAPAFQGMKTDFIKFPQNRQHI